MSVLPAQAHTELAQLLSALQSTDNNVRSQAEDHLTNNWVNTKPEMLLMGLVEHIYGSSDANTRSFAAVIFRRIASKSRKTDDNNTIELFLVIPKQSAYAIRQKLIEALGLEKSNSVRNKIGDAVAEIAREYSDNGEQWPEILGVLSTLSSSQEPGQREIAYRIFATTPGIIEKQHEDTVLTAFKNGFQDNETAVRLAAMEAFASFFSSLGKKSQPKYYALIPEVLSILPPLKESQDSEGLTTALVSLMNLAEVAPKMFKPLFHNLVTFCIQIIQDKEFTDQARQNALELMATFADYAPAMVKKDPSFVTDMITQCLSLMTDIGADDDDASEWNASDDMDPEESDLNHVAGEQCMDRLANKLGGTIILAPTFNWLPRMMLSEAWRDRHAALMAISAISEGCRDLMLGELNKVLELVIPALSDPHPRVRWAGCNALGQMSTDFAGTMQEQYHQPVLTNIIPVLKSAEPRVQAHAAAALVNFCEEAEKRILEPYLDDLLTQLFQLLQSPKRYVQEQALSTIATIADSAEAAFSKYYDTLMPILFNVLKADSTKELRLLRAKAMECATLIALAVGRERLGNDATVLVQLLATVQQGLVDADDPQAQYLMHCWGRMCRVMGTDFLEYLGYVMPPLLELASAKADIQLLDDEDEVEAVQAQEGWELVPLKGKVIGIKTSTLDDKHMAIELLVVYAQVLEAQFAPYVEIVMGNIALPGLAFFFHDPVRVVSAKCVPQLLNSYKKAYSLESPQLSNLWQNTIPKILEVLSAEPAIDTLAEMYQCFYESVEVMGNNCLTQQHMELFMESAISALVDYKDRVKARIEERADANREEGDEDSEETLYAIEDDQTLLSDMNKAFHCIFKNHGTAFLPSWEKLLTTYSAFLSSDDPTQRQWGLCIIDDVLEFCGGMSYNYMETLIKNPLIAGCQDPAPANRQAATYGIGVAAQKGGSQWTQFVGSAIKLLFDSTQIPNARGDDDVYATENACAAIAKILHFNASGVENQQQVVTAWIDTLPVVNDEEAAPYAYGFLSQLIEQQNPAVTSQPAKIFVFVVQALEAETLQGQFANKIVEDTKNFLAAAGLNIAQLLAQLSPETQATVQAYFS
ncbi:importin subunit beta-3 [Sclerotinia borealis F-4128]|uniref:Importin subunit beta-3 n=1 Tax=Sclerotinia borealis (strain F-4128) TaxID=1432307 RepID=W9CHF8_SCLBF|nr:importin subunit beta-3 [Sclerotinia borealis F-4128]